jgi:hypothetical protein
VWRPPKGLLEFGPRRHSSAVEQLFRKQQVLGSNPSVGSSDHQRGTRSDGPGFVLFGAEIDSWIGRWRPVGSTIPSGWRQEDRPQGPTRQGTSKGCFRSLRGARHRPILRTMSETGESGERAANQVGPLLLEGRLRRMKGSRALLLSRCPESDAGVIWRHGRIALRSSARVGLTRPHRRGAGGVRGGGGVRMVGRRANQALSRVLQPAAPDARVHAEAVHPEAMKSPSGGNHGGPFAAALSPLVEVGPRTTDASQKILGLLQSHDQAR